MVEVKQEYQADAQDDEHINLVEGSTLFVTKWDAMEVMYTMCMAVVSHCVELITRHPGRMRRSSGMVQSSTMVIIVVKLEQRICIKLHSGEFGAGGWFPITHVRCEDEEAMKRAKTYKAKLNCTK